MIELLITAMLLGVGSGAFALFLDSCMEEGMIFHWWYKDIERVGSLNKTWSFLMKPLGLCIYCMSEWCFIVIMTVFITKFPTLIQNEFVLLCVGSGFNFFIIDLWQKKMK